MTHFKILYCVPGQTADLSALTDLWSAVQCTYSPANRYAEVTCWSFLSLVAKNSDADALQTADRCLSLSPYGQRLWGKGRDMPHVVTWAKIHRKYTCPQNDQRAAIP